MTKRPGYCKDLMLVSCHHRGNYEKNLSPTLTIGMFTPLCAHLSTVYLRPENGTIRLRTYAAANRRFPFKSRDFVAHNHADFLESLQGIKCLQQFLFLLWIGDKVRCQHI